MTVLEELRTDVEDSGTVETSTVTLIKGIADRIAEAGIDPVKLQDLEAELRDHAVALGDAVIVGTNAEEYADPNAGATAHDPSIGEHAGATPRKRTDTLGGPTYDATRTSPVSGDDDYHDEHDREVRKDK